jgi:hypothetical protein
MLGRQQRWQQQQPASVSKYLWLLWWHQTQLQGPSGVMQSCPGHRQHQSWRPPAAQTSWGLPLLVPLLRLLTVGWWSCRGEEQQQRQWSSHQQQAALPRAALLLVWQQQQQARGR